MTGRDMLDTSQAEGPRPFWRKALEVIALAVLPLIVEAIFRKMGDIDVFGSAVCTVVHSFSNNALWWHC
jgi:hypothetical protein